MADSGLNNEQEILDHAFKRGIENEKKCTGCAQSVIDAIQSAIGAANDDEFRDPGELQEAARHGMMETSSIVVGIAARKATELILRARAGEFDTPPEASGGTCGGGTCGY